MILTSSLWVSDWSNKRNKKSHCPISSAIKKLHKNEGQNKYLKCKCILEWKINFRKAAMLLSIRTGIKF